MFHSEGARVHKQVGLTSLPEFRLANSAMDLVCLGQLPLHPFKDADDDNDGNHQQEGGVTAD